MENITTSLFQCIHSFYSFFSSHNDVELARHRDNLKKDLCVKNGISLIVVPYWWNSNVESIASTIHSVRPDIPIEPSLLTGDTIPTQIPPARREKGRKIYS